MTARLTRILAAPMPYIGIASLGLFAATPAAAQEQRTQVQPYVEVDQVIFSDLSGGGGTDTYTSVAAGIDASTYTRRVMARANLRYQHSFSWDDDTSDVDIFSGLVNGAFLAGRGLSVEGGAVASRTRVDASGNVAGTRLGDEDNITDIYSLYAGPTYSGNIGTVGVGASYRFGYTAVDSEDFVAGPGGADQVDYFDDSTQHVLNASVGQNPGPLPVGWQVSGSYRREDASQLDQRVEDHFVRGDLTVPVSATLALVGGVGYEKVEISERDVVRGGNGLPIIGDDGRFVTDDNSPRLTSFSTDGLLWDVGVLWRPSSRTSLEARVGRRYDSTTYYGSLSWAASSRTGVNVSVYDRVSGFGGLINDALSSIGPDFDVARDPFTGDLQGCAVGTDGATCFGSAFQSARSAALRARGVTASIATRTGRWRYGGAIGYQSRDYYASNLGGQASLSGTEDEAWFAALSGMRAIGRNASLGVNVYGNAFNGARSDDTIYTFGANAVYGRELIRNLNLNAAVGIDTVQYEDIEDRVTASGLLGLRYGF